ncbi:MAG TPA: hypothetical protein VH062_26920 [Polyangiaceae bacterium]|jgi:hypothetical protein|nr:hypothetical protein [Polyangiaceae bacterium]
MFLFACSSSGGDAQGAGGATTFGGAGPVGAGGTGVGGVGVSTGGTSYAGSGNTPVGAGGTIGAGGSNGGTGAVISGGGTGAVGAGGGSAGMAVGGSAGAGAGGAGAGGAAGGTGIGCPGQNLAAVPADTSMRGPWAVGVKTVHIGRLTIEITYPAQAGSEAGKPPVTYDTRDWLPKNATQGAGFTPIADSESPAVQPLNGPIYRDLPLDATHGPYPVIIFMHGTASFRVASGTAQATWASRGFVVVAADYPGLFLGDQLCTSGCGCAATGAADYPGDFKLQTDALTAGTGDVAFLKGHVDMAHIGFAGHSVGGCTVVTQADTTGASVVIGLSSAAPIMSTGGKLKSLMFMSGMSDTVFNYASGGGLGNFVCPGATGAVTDAYKASTGATKTRLVGVTNGGHLTPTDLCQKNADGNNAIQVLHNHHWCGVDAVAIVGLPTLFDCGANGFDYKVGVTDTIYATTAAFEETLTCTDRTAAFMNIKTAETTIGDFQTK